MRTPVRVLLMAALVMGAFLVGTWYSRTGSGGSTPDGGQRPILYYVDPMNPAHTSDRPGPAPCGMPMEPVYADEAGAVPRRMVPGTARITPEKQQMLGVRWEQMTKASHERPVRALGKVEADENRTHRLVASTQGWVREVRGGTTGSFVEKDQVLAMVYNNEIFSRLANHFYALDADRRRMGGQQTGSNPTEAFQPLSQGQGGPLATAVPSKAQPPVPNPEDPKLEAQQPSWNPGTAAGSGFTGFTKDLVYFTKQELFGLGMSQTQIEEIAKTRQFSVDLEIRSPVTGIVLSRNVFSGLKYDRGAEFFTVADLTRVWILADVFERDAAYVKPGSPARVTLPRQGKSFDAVVTEVPPVFDASTRTFKVRLEADNPDLALRPDMFVDVEFRLSMPEAVTVPVDAVMDSGMNQTVFLDAGDGYFEPRSVKTGWRHGGRVEILEGLKPGDRVVVSGNFLVDSESRMKLAAAGMHRTTRKDPVCGMDVSPGKSSAAGLVAEHGGRQVHFCSEQCRREFEKDPERFALKSPEGGRPGADRDMKTDEAGLAVDPVCGMPVDKSKAKAYRLTVDHEGKTRHFCAEQCRKRFEMFPGPYTEKDAGAKAPSGHAHSHVHSQSESRLHD